MTKAPSNLQDLRRRIYRKAKSDKSHRFWGLFVHITKVEDPRRGLPCCQKEWRRHPASMARSLRTSNKLGGPTFSRQYGKTWKQAGTSPCEPAGGYSEREWQIPNASDSLYTRTRGARGTEAHPEAIFEADFCPNSYGFRPRRSPQPRTGGSQTQCDAAHVNHYRC